MRKFLVVLSLLSVFIITSRVVSTEKQLPYSSQEIYYLTESDYGFYYKEPLESPMVYGETAIYANEDLIKESGKLTPGTTFKIVEWRLNRQGIPVFKLDNHQFVVADKRLVYDQSHVQTQSRQVWLEPRFVIYNSPYDAKEISSSLSPYQRVIVDRTLFAEGQEFLHIDQVGWVSKEFVSEEDNRIQKVQEILSNNYQNEKYSIYVKQLSTGKEAGVNEDSKLYAASILKLAYLYYAQDKINQGEYTLDSSFKYIPEVNSFPGSYKPEGSGSLPKKEDNKDYSLQQLITKVTKESDNVAHNILGYYVTNQSDGTFKEKMSTIMGEDWDVNDKLTSSKMAGKVMEAIYNQNGFVLESLSKTNFDNQRIAKGVSVKVAHKIGDADEFKHDTAIVYTDSPFVLSIFTKNSDYDTIAKIAKDVYEVLK